MMMDLGANKSPSAFSIDAIMSRDLAMRQNPLLPPDHAGMEHALRTSLHQHLLQESLAKPMYTGLEHHMMPMGLHYTDPNLALQLQAKAAMSQSLASSAAAAALGVPKHPLHMYSWLSRPAFFSHRLPGSEPSFLLPFRKPKRIRTAFSPSQLLRLEHAFEKNHYVVGQERKDLAVNLGLTETQVKVWFQNRRTKYKRVKSDEEGDGPDDRDSPEPPRKRNHDERESPEPRRLSSTVTSDDNITPDQSMSSPSSNMTSMDHRPVTGQNMTNSSMTSPKMSYPVMSYSHSNMTSPLSPSPSTSSTSSAGHHLDITMPSQPSDDELSPRETIEVT